MDLSVENDFHGYEKPFRYHYSSFKQKKVFGISTQRLIPLSIDSVRGGNQLGECIFR